MHKPAASISNSSARERTAAGIESALSARTFSASCSETDLMPVDAFMRRQMESNEAFDAQLRNIRTRRLRSAPTRPLQRRLQSTKGPGQSVRLTTNVETRGAQYRLRVESGQPANEFLRALGMRRARRQAHRINGDVLHLRRQRSDERYAFVGEDLGHLRDAHFERAAPSRELRHC